MNKSSLVYAQLTGARAIVVNRYYGTTPLGGTPPSWPTSVVCRQCPSLHCHQRDSLSNDGRVATSARSSLRSIRRLRLPLRCELAWFSRLNTALV